MAHSYALPPLEGISSLLAAGELGSFTAAAESLGITHGSVSRRIAVLEAWVGTPLFERHGRGVRLTPAGERFSREARAALETLQRSPEQWRPRGRKSTVRVSVVPSFAKLWLLPRLAELERLAPGIHVDLLTDPRMVELDGREADIAVRYGKGGWRDLRASLLFEEMLVPAATPLLAERLGGERRPERLPELPLLHDSDISQWRAWFAQQGMVYRPRPGDRKFEDYDTVLAAAEAGLGAVLLRVPLADEWLARGKLVRLGLPEMKNPAKHFLVTGANEAREPVALVADRLLAMARAG